MWYYKNNDDEFELYGFDENDELENSWKQYMNGKSGPIKQINCGYFANCDDRYNIDFENFVQCNIDTKESRKIIRAIPNSELKKTFTLVNPYNNNNNNSNNNNNTNDLLFINDLLKQQNNNGDAVSINIPLIMNNILNDTLFIYGQQYDIPIASVFINQLNNYKSFNKLLNNFVIKQSNDNNFSIIKLYEFNIKLNSSMVSYLISEKKCNFILYDTNFKLLAVGKYNGEYIYNNNNNNNINPYRYNSFINFHSLLTLFYALSQSNNNNIRVKSLISCFNTNIRILSKNLTFTPSINNKQTFKEIINKQEEERKEEEEAYDSSSEEEEEEECSVCYENIINDDTTHHKDLCYSCLMQWKQRGNDSCPKCGITH